MSYTPEEITEILEAYFESIAHRQYIGARYVPIFGRKDEESIEWDGTAPYEPLTIVLHEGNSYTSRQYVPAGASIDNEAYWALTGNFNAQVEQYRRDVADLAENVSTLSTNLSTEISDRKTDTGRIYTFATVADMLASEDLREGALCFVGGNSWYAISDTGDASEIGTYAYGDLFAVRANKGDEITSASIGLSGSVLGSDFAAIIGYAAEAGQTLYIDSDIETTECVVTGVDNISMVGDGIHKIKSAEGIVRCIRIIDCDNVVLRDLVIDGNHLLVSDTEQAAGIRFDGGSHILVDNCEIYNTRGDGITLRQSDDTSDPVSDVVISKCHIHDNYRNGITFGSGLRHVKVSDCTFDGYIFAQSLDFEPQGDTVCDDVVVCDCWIDGGSYTNLFSIKRADIAANRSKIVVARNVFINTIIYCAAGFNTVFEDNTMIFNNPLLITSGTHGWPLNLSASRDLWFVRNSVYFGFNLSEAVSTSKSTESPYEGKNVWICDNDFNIEGTAQVTKLMRLQYGMNGLHVCRNKVKVADTASLDTFLHVQRSNNQYGGRDIMVAENEIDSCSTLVYFSFASSTAELVAVAVKDNYIEACNGTMIKYDSNTASQYAGRPVIENNVANTKGNDFLAMQTYANLVWLDGGTYKGNQSPEAFLTAAIGSTFVNTQGSVGSALYAKTTDGTLDTGWTALA